MPIVVVIVFLIFFLILALIFRVADELAGGWGVIFSGAGIWALWYLSKRKKEKEGMREVLANEAAKKQYEEEIAQRTLADKKYARERFIKKFLSFGAAPFLERGHELKRKIESSIVIPVIWEESCETIPFRLSPFDMSENDTDAGDVIRCYDKNRQLIAIQTIRCREYTWGGGNYGIPPFNYSRCTEKILTLKSGEEVHVLILVKEVRGKLEGYVHYEFGKFLEPEHLLYFSRNRYQV